MLSALYMWSRQQQSVQICSVFIRNRPVSCTGQTIQTLLMWLHSQLKNLVLTFSVLVTIFIVFKVIIYHIN